MITIYHNNRCGKSREALRLVEASGQAYQVRQYLSEPLNLDELKELHQKLKLPVMEMVRTKESVFKEQFKDKEMDDDALLQAIAQYPILLERAIVEKDNRAVIARPPEKTLDVL
jgi:arsenate reductase (glutaredoxin)